MAEWAYVALSTTGQASGDVALCTTLGKLWDERVTPCGGYHSILLSDEYQKWRHTYMYIYMGFTFQTNFTIRYLFFTIPYKFWLRLRIRKEEKYTTTCQNHYYFLIPCLLSRPLICLSLTESEQQEETLCLKLIMPFWFLWVNFSTAFISVVVLTRSCSQQ